MVKDKLDWTTQKWGNVILALDAKIAELSALPEPLRSMYALPFVEQRNELVEWINSQVKK